MILFELTDRLRGFRLCKATCMVEFIASKDKKENLCSSLIVGIAFENFGNMPETFLVNIMHFKRGVKHYRRVQK